MRKKFILPEFDICQKYIDGKNSNELSQEFNCWPHNILKILNKHGIERRSGSEIRRKHQINESYFEKIDSETKSYFLGFLCADGCVSNKNIRNCSSLSLFIHFQDYAIVESLAKLLYINPTPLQSTSRRLVGFRIYSEKLCKDLIKLNCTPNKTHSLEFPKAISEELIPHFIRGYFDGDGCITGKKRRATCSFNGSFSFISHLKNIFDEIKITSCFTDQNKYGKKCYTISISSKSGINSMFDYLYKNATIFLPRKYEKFKERIYSLQ